MPDDILHLSIYCLTAVIAAACNSVAGGGTFFTFPTLLFYGMPAIQANATSTAALWPGTLASAYAYREDAVKHKDKMPRLITISLIGGTAGAITLLYTPEQTFRELIPWLLLTATVLFAISPKVTDFLHRITKDNSRYQKTGTLGSTLMQLGIAFYGGYFGAGIGILMLAMLGLMGMRDIHEMNGLKTILGSAINATAVALFIFMGVIVWKIAIVMMVGGMIGGYWGARIAKHVPRPLIRGIVIATGSILTVIFFINN
jgi:uncharacterized membrane protein YfcA